MRLQCPSCAAVMDLDVLLSHEEGRHTLALLIAKGTQLGPWTLRYIGLFRPEKRALSMSRTLKLLEELWPDMERQAVTCKGRDWPAPPSVWQQAFEHVLSIRDRGGLTLPLTSHGYLYVVIAGIADKAEAQQEREREQQARSRPHAAGPVHVGDVGQPHAASPPEPRKPVTGGPGFRALKERITGKRSPDKPPEPSDTPSE